MWSENTEKLMLIVQEHSLKKREPKLVGEVIRDLIHQGLILQNLKQNGYAKQ